MKQVFFLLTMILGLTKCTADGVTSDSSGSVANGSYSTMITVGDYLYRVSTMDLATFDISDGSTPVLIDEQDVGFEIESIFHTNGVLFIGSSLALHIFTIEADGIPARASETAYGDFDVDQTPCDPVVADEEYAFVTLSTIVGTSGPCSRPVAINQLRVYDVIDITAPDLLATYDLVQPKGLAIDGDLLFVCDGSAGLRIYDRTDALNLEELYHFTGFTTFDVIARGGLLMVVGPDNIYQFDYTDRDNVIQLGTIKLT
jgi:hypothetical protein